MNEAKQIAQALDLILANQMTHTYDVSTFKVYENDNNANLNRNRNRNNANNNNKAKNKYWKSRYNRNHNPDRLSVIHPTICNCTCACASSQNGARDTHGAHSVQESTSTLFAARALMKGNRTEEAWSYLQSLFSSQGTNGFVPKYQYQFAPDDNYTNTGSDSDGKMMDMDNNGGGGGDDVSCEDGADSYYYMNTLIPTPNMFQYKYYNGTNNNDTNASKLMLLSMPKTYQPCPQDKPSYPSSCFNSHNQYTFVTELNITYSNRLAAVPFHGSVVLDMFYLSPQTKEDLEKLEFYFDRVYKLHGFWMDHVMKYCGVTASASASTSASTGPNNEGHLQKGSDTSIGQCYNIVHPWESVVEMNSPQWNDILKFVMEIVKEKEWVPPPNVIPDHVKSSHQYPNDERVYHAMLYLLECQTNAIAINKPGNYEKNLINQCPFAMMDLAHFSILSRSNSDLYQIGKILTSLYSAKAPSKTRLNVMKGWTQRIKKIEDYLWDEDHTRDGSIGRYASRSLLFLRRDAESGDGNDDDNHSICFDVNGSEFVKSHSAANLIVDLNPAANSSRFTSSVVMPLMDRNEEFSFNCGGYPIWSWACSRNDANIDVVIDENRMSSGSLTAPSIYPMMNYLISTSLKRNGAKGLASYIEQSTLQMMCASADERAYDVIRLPTDTCDNLTFGTAYSGRNGAPFNHASPCDMTSTISATILYNLLVPDGAFSFKPSPPIQHGWIIVLVIAEIAVAFSIGLSCLLLSLNLMQRLKKDAEGDAILQLARDQNEEESSRLLEEEGDVDRAGDTGRAMVGEEDHSSGSEGGEDGVDTLLSFFRKSINQE